MLACILAHRRGRHGLLEVGAGNGTFAKLCAPEFDAVAAIDFSRTAITFAKAATADHSNLRFEQADIRSLALGERFDVIVCAAVLNAISVESDHLVLERLSAHLAPRGILVYVAGSRRPADPWGNVLASRFAILSDVRIDDPERPYRIAVFADEDGRSEGIRRVAHAPR